MLMKKLLIAGVALASGTAAFAQDYFDFGRIRGVPDEPTVQLDLSPMLLGLAREAVRADNPEIADLLASIDGVRVRIYSELEAADDVVEFIEEAANRLERDNWQRVVSIQNDENVSIYVRGMDSTVTGFTAMVISDGEAIFVNIAGSISPDQLAQSMASLGVSDMLASLGELNLGILASD